MWYQQLYGSENRRFNVGGLFSPFKQTKVYYDMEKTLHITDGQLLPLPNCILTLSHMIRNESLSHWSFELVGKKCTRFLLHRHKKHSQTDCCPLLKVADLINNLDTHWNTLINVRKGDIMVRTSDHWRRRRGSYLCRTLLPLRCDQTEVHLACCWCSISALYWKQNRLMMW